MHHKKVVIPFFTLLLLLSPLSLLQAASQASMDLSGDPGYQAFTKAAKTNKYLMVHLYSGTQDQALVKSCDAANDVLNETLNIVAIDVTGTGSDYLIEKYNLRYAPVPIVIIIAPNGVISGSFQSSFSPEQVKSTFRSPKTLQCLLAFQERKLVFISAQGEKTAENTEAVAGIKRFINENPLYGPVELILLDPTDTSEAPLLAQLKIQPDIRTAQTFLLVPPGRILGRWSGATEPGAFVNQLNALAKSCSVPSCADPNCK